MKTVAIISKSEKIKLAVDEFETAKKALFALQEKMRSTIFFALIEDGALPEGSTEKNVFIEADVKNGIIKAMTKADVEEDPKALLDLLERVLK